MATQKNTKMNELTIITVILVTLLTIGENVTVDLLKSSGYFRGKMSPATATSVMAIIRPRFSMEPKNRREGIVTSAMAEMR